MKAVASALAPTLRHNLCDNAMSVSGEHLSQERLSGKAMDVLTELKGLLEAIEFKPERNNLLCCDNLPALFDIVQRLTKELHFITVKV